MRILKIIILFPLAALKETKALLSQFMRCPWKHKITQGMQALDLMDQVGLGCEEWLVEDVHMSVWMGAPKEKTK